METARIILLVLAILFIIVTLIVYFKTRKELKSDKKILKKDIEKHVKIYTILLIISSTLGLAAAIINVISNSRWKYGIWI